VRLSEDDGPPAHSFLGDDEEIEEDFSDGSEDGDNARANTQPVELQTVGITRFEVVDPEDVPPIPPAKDRA
jgi:hypothetical protein